MSDEPKKKFNPELRTKFDVAIKQAIDSTKECAAEYEREFALKVCQQQIDREQAEAKNKGEAA